MSLINEALKKAALEAGPDEDALQHAYPQKLFFISGRRAGSRSLTLLLGGLILIAGLAAVWQLEPTRNRLLGLIGMRPPATASRMAVPIPTDSPGAAASDQPAQPPPAVDRAEMARQLQAGITAFHSGDLEVARLAFVGVLERDPTAAAAQNGLGLIEKTLGNLEQAERHYQEAIRLAPEYAEPHNNLALLYDQRGETNRAVIEYSTALSLRPDYPEARLNYAVTLERGGQRAEAKRQYQKFLADSPPALAEVAETVKTHLATFP